MTLPWLSRILTTAALAAGPALAQIGGGGFGGPAVLGRPGQNANRGGGGGSIRVFGAVQGIYDSGISAVAVNERGEIPQQGLSGLEAQVGAVGTKNFRRSVLSINYQGDYRKYSAGNAFSGTTQFLNVSYQRQVTRRTTAAISGVAGTSNLAFNNIFLPGAGGDPFSGGPAGVPFNGFFDTRTYFATAQAQVVFQHTARLSTSLSGGGFAVRRRILNFADTDGATARADVNYRLGRRTTIGVDFGYQNYQFPRAFGDASIFDLGILYSASLSRTWTLGLRAGAFRIETLGSRQVSVDPAIAAITGFTQALEVSYTKNTFPSYSATLEKRFRTGSFSIVGQTGASPGNGVFLAARNTLVGATYHYTINRRAVADVSFSFNRFGGLGLITGGQDAYNTGAGVGYKLNRWMQLTGRFMRRQAALTSANANVFNLNGNRISVGVTFSPTELPIPAW